MKRGNRGNRAIRRVLPQHILGTDTGYLLKTAAEVLSKICTNRLKDLGNKLLVAKEKVGEGINLEFGIDTHF